MTTQTRYKAETVRVIGPLRSRINALAHSQALQAEMRLRADLMRTIQTAADGGATLTTLHEMVDGLETGAQEGDSDRKN
jgi:hypothetical protein